MTPAQRTAVVMRWLMLFAGASGLSLTAAEEDAAVPPLSSLGATEVYATADDGAPLHWITFAPAKPGRYPAIVVLPGGGFITARPNTGIDLTARDLAAAGFVAFVVEYRLAPPGRIAGQKSDGRFPDQNNDVHLAIRAARKDPRGNGQVGGVGGSAGAYHVAWAAVTGTAGDDQLDAGICLSGPYDFAEAESLASRAGYRAKVFNFVGSSDPLRLLAASPVSFVTKKIPPLFLIASEDEAVPPGQIKTMVALLRSTGVTTFQHLVLPGVRHSYPYWPNVRDQSIAFLHAAIAKPERPNAAGTPPIEPARRQL
jgi:acetyl esterase/lipase